MIIDPDDLCQMVRVILTIQLAKKFVNIFFFISAGNEDRYPGYRGTGVRLIAFCAEPSGKEDCYQNRITGNNDQGRYKNEGRHAIRIQL